MKSLAVTALQPVKGEKIDAIKEDKKTKGTFSLLIKDKKADKSEKKKDKKDDVDTLKEKKKNSKVSEENVGANLTLASVDVNKKKRAEKESSNVVALLNKGNGKEGNKADDAKKGKNIKDIKGTLKEELEAEENDKKRKLENKNYGDLKEIGHVSLKEKNSEVTSKERSNAKAVKKEESRLTKAESHSNALNSINEKKLEIKEKDEKNSKSNQNFDKARTEKPFTEERSVFNQSEIAQQVKKYGTRDRKKDENDKSSMNAKSVREQKFKEPLDEIKTETKKTVSTQARQRKDAKNVNEWKNLKHLSFKVSAKEEVSDVKQSNISSAVKAHFDETSIKNMNTSDSGKFQQFQDDLRKNEFEDVFVKFTRESKVESKDGKEFKRMIFQKVIFISKDKNLEDYVSLPQLNRGGAKEAVVVKQEHLYDGKSAEHISKQIVTAISKALENQKPPLKVEIKLDPPSLGKITIEITEKAGKTSLFMNVENAKTRELMKMLIPVMTNQLSNLNFNVVDVQLNGQQWLDDGSSNHQRKQEQREQKRENDENDFTKEFKEFRKEEV